MTIDEMLTSLRAGWLTRRGYAPPPSFDVFAHTPEALMHVGECMDRLNCMALGYMHGFAEARMSR